jgi:class 3 adenylate cyclase/tetratricopeptide (TPR) repeat protein
MSSVGGERKIATMLFADLVGSTELASGLDPEEIRGRLEPFFDTARGALEQHGGTVEKYIGDAVMAVFGAPVSHGDDPDRAVAAGLEVTRRVADLDGQLAVRIGIETGEVLSVPEAGSLRVTGEAVNAAARLQQAASPGEVLVGERAARACRRAELEPNGAVEGKGIDRPMAAFKALAVCDETEVSAIPLIGRDDDLEMLRLIARRAARERLPQLVTVIGEAGIGKTRLAGELFRELSSEGWRTVVGRSPPYGEGISFWALGEMLRDAADVSTDAPADELEASLAGELAKLGAEDASQVAAALTVAVRGSEEQGQEDLSREWRRFVSLLASDRPLAIGIDDAHWADEGTLELLEDVAFGLHETPLLVICTSRPELAERRPDFGRSARNNTQLELLPLDPDAATRMAELLLPEAERESARRIADAAGGNPFFTEEVSRALREGGDAVERLPDTVQAAVAARIDQLPPEEKRALQYASVLGHTFSRGPLGDLLGDSPSDALWALRRRALVEERPGSEAGHYVFRHQLIREVAYNSLPRRERAELHERAVDALLARGDFAELPELVGYHLDHAYELDPTDERRQAAREALIEAADSAVRRGATARGRQLYEDAARLGEEGGEQLDALMAAADVSLRAWRGDHALRLFREAGTAAEHAGEPGRAALAYARAVETGTRMHGISGDPPPAELEPLLARGHQLVPDGDTETKARLRLDDAWMAWTTDRQEEMAAAAEEGLALARHSDDRQLLQNALDAATASDWIQGRQSSAVEHCRERLELLEDAPRSHALDVEISDALHMMVLCLIQVGEFDEAVRYARRGAEVDLSRGVEFASYQRELLPCFFTGDWDRALELADGSRRAWEEEGRPPLGSFATPAASIAAIYGFRGEDALSAEWLAHARKLAETEHETGVLAFATEIELHRGNFDEAAAVAREPNFSSQWAASFAASRAEAFVRSGRDSVDAISWAEGHVGEDRYANGVLLRTKALFAGDDTKLREAMELFEQLGCPYQAARTGWLLGDEERERARGIFERLGSTVPAD